MDFTERMLERNRSRYAKSDSKEWSNQQSAPLKEVHHNTVTTIASTSVDIKKNSGSNKVTIETTVTMHKVPKETSRSSLNKNISSEVVSNDEATSNTEEESNVDEKENDVSEEFTCPLRQDTKSRLQRLGVLYSDDPTRLSSPIHRTEERFFTDEKEPPLKSMKSTARSARLAALADTINHWEDDIKPHSMGEEAQGFSRSESKQKLIYSYNLDKKTSPAKSSSTSDESTESDGKISPVKSKSPPKATSPVKERYNSPIQMGKKAKENTTLKTNDEDNSVPTMGVKQLRSPRKPAPNGSVLDRALRYEQSTSPTKRSRDPAELSLAERLALFEGKSGGAVLPKAPFAMPVPASKLQNQSTNNLQLPNQKEVEKKLSTQHASKYTSESTSSLQDRLHAFERCPDNNTKSHMKEIYSEREKEMEMLKHRWGHLKSTTESQDFKPSAPPMSPVPPIPPPIPSPPLQHNIGYTIDHSDYDLDDYDENAKLKTQGHQEEKSPEITYPVLKEVKKFKLSPPKPGRIYPCLSDMETESEVVESEIDDNDNNDNNRSSSTYSSNESDINSLGQDIVKLSRSSLKRVCSESDQSENEGAMVDEVDDFLDEALNDSSSCSDEPTPPKRSLYNHDVGSVSSTSFAFSQNGSQHKEPNQPLLHTISFYRKQQALVTNTTSPPKHYHIDPTPYSTDDSVERMEEELDKELKLVEQKIDKLREEVLKQQTYISQASQALNLCYSTIEFSGSVEQVEAEKLLLLATQRRQAAQHEIQRLRVEQTLRPQTPGTKVLTEKGSLTLSQITLPLKMDVIHQAAKDDQCYHLVCLVHCDERVLNTDVMCAPRSLHDTNKITFPNVLTLDGLYSDFKVTLEVYTMTARSKELIPHDVKYHINTNKKEASKLKLTPRKLKGDSKLLKPSVQSPGGPSAVRTSAFSRAGYVIFSLREVQRKQFSLNKNMYTSVLEGYMHLKIESEMSVDIEYRGFLTMFEDVSGFGAWHRRWCLLKGDKLSYWKYPEDERKRIALDTIELSACTTQEVGPVPRDVCARANTFLLETSRPTRTTDAESLVLFKDGDKTIIRHLLSADTKDDRIQWCQHLNKALALIRAWGVPT